MSDPLPDPPAGTSATAGAAVGGAANATGTTGDSPKAPLQLTRDGAIATILLDRPAALNTLDFTLMDALVDAVASVAADDTLRVLVIAGAGRHFMAGGDLRTFAAELHRPPAERAQFFRPLIAHLHAAIETMHRMPQVVIAQARGAVAGFGLSLLCACDLAVAADDAYFSAAYRHIGLSPDGGGTYALPRLVGVRKAMEILLLAERFDAHEALRLGIVNRVVAVDALEATVAAMAATLADGPARATRNTKRLVRESLARSLSGQLDAEAESFAACAADADFAEGLEAFFAKRPPRFA
jgi:2-(1,2-epoxy-1,2-dihydrophenyl)acetyl-CoA isomerase